MIGNLYTNSVLADVCSETNMTRTGKPPSAIFHNIVTFKPPLKFTKILECIGVLIGVLEDGGKEFPEVGFSTWK